MIIDHRWWVVIDGSGRIMYFRLAALCVNEMQIFFNVTRDVLMECEL